MTDIKLHKFDLDKIPEEIIEAKVIGVDTKENIQSGIMFGAIDQIEGMIQRIKKEQPDDYIIILSGGFSKILSPYLSNQHILDIDLTLKGMILIDELSS